MGAPGGLGFIERRFSLRASVGLMVLAPNPVTCGMVDWRLLDVDEGVCVRWVMDRAGERAWLIGVPPCSGVIECVFRNPCCGLEGGCRDFALAERVGLGTLDGSALVLEFMPDDKVGRRLLWLNEGVRPTRPCERSLEGLGTS